MKISKRAPAWEWIVFDVDGVLIDVSESYDVATTRTVEAFVEELGLNYPVTPELVRTFRKKGRFGDDYHVSEGLVLAGLSQDPVEYIKDFPVGKGLDEIREEFGKSLDQTEVRKTFDDLYLGNTGSCGETDGDGLWTNETPIVERKLIEDLSRHFSVGYVTGRNRKEARLAELILSFEMDNLMTRDDAPKKPNPESLKVLVGEEPGVYVGDTENDRKLVNNFGRVGGDFDFIMISSKGRSTVEIVEEIIDVVKTD